MGGTCFEKVRKRQFIQKNAKKIKLFPLQALHDSSRLPSASRSRLCPSLEPCLPDCEHLELTSYEYVIPTDAERLCMDRESPFRFRSQNFFICVCESGNFIVMMFLTERCAPRERVSPY